MVNLKESKVTDYIRYVFSFALLVFSSVVTFYAIWTQKTSFWKAVPGWAAIILFLVVLVLLGIMEGLQIALVELKRQHPDTYKHSHPRAYKLGQVAAIDDNIEKFLMGRQVSVVCLVFFAAKLTTIHGRDEDGFLFPVPEVVQTLLLETGLLACVIVVIVAQLVPQIVASQYPVQFMQLFVNMPAYYTCIALEMTGITHFTWVLAHLASLGMDKDFERGETGSHDTRPTGNNNGSKDDIPGHTRGNQNVAYCQEV